MGVFIKEKVAPGFQTQVAWSYTLCSFGIARGVIFLPLSALKNNFGA